MHLSGKSGNALIVRNACSLFLDKKWVNYIHYIEKSNENNYIYDDERITRDKNEELYEILRKKHTEGIYNKRPCGIGDALEKGKDKYRVLSKENQCRVILQMLLISSIGNNKADLSLVDGVTMMGNMRINKDISKNERFILVLQSKTGMFTDESINLKTI